MKCGCRNCIKCVCRFCYPFTAAKTNGFDLSLDTENLVNLLYPSYKQSMSLYQEHEQKYYQRKCTPKLYKRSVTILTPRVFYITNTLGAFKTNSLTPLVLVRAGPDGGNCEDSEVKFRAVMKSKVLKNLGNRDEQKVIQKTKGTIDIPKQESMVWRNKDKRPARKSRVKKKLQYKSQISFE